MWLHCNGKCYSEYCTGEVGAHKQGASCLCTLHVSWRRPHPSMLQRCPCPGRVSWGATMWPLHSVMLCRGSAMATPSHRGRAPAYHWELVSWSLSTASSAGMMVALATAEQTIGRHSLMSGYTAWSSGKRSRPVPVTLPVGRAYFGTHHQIRGCGLQA